MVETFLLGDEKMTTQEREKMIKDLEEKWGYPVTKVLELLKNLDEDASAENTRHENSEIWIKQRVTDIIHEISIPAHLKGYQYLREAIVLAYKKPESINAITKVLYPTVAEICNTTSNKVERSIRHAIDTAWSQCDVKILNKYFGHATKLTNSEFIACIADLLRLEYEK